MGLNLDTIPRSVLIGFAGGFIIGFLVGVFSGGFILEVFFRSLLSGLLLGGTFFGVEQLLRRFASEVFDQSSDRSKVDLKEEDSDITLGDIYSQNNEPSEDVVVSPKFKEFDQNESFVPSDLDQSISFSEDNVFGSKVEGLDGSKDEFDKVDYGQFVSEPSSGPTFEQIDFSRLSSAELGVTKESRGGITNDYIIPPKSQKPIPKDYKKLAEIIRTKLKEEQ